MKPAIYFIENVLVFLAYGIVLVLKRIPNHRIQKILESPIQMISAGSNFFEELEKRLSDNRNKTVHIHCPSVGEFFQLEEIIKILIKKNYACVLTFTSYSLWKWLTHHQENRFLLYHYMPVPFSKNMDLLYDRLNPEFAIISKDIWQNMVNSAKTRQIPLFLAAASISEKCSRFGFKWLYRFRLAGITAIFAVNNLNKTRFNMVLPKVLCEVTGDPRFDATYQKRIEKPDKVPVKNENEFVLVVGSSHQKDNEIILPVLNKFLSEYSRLKIIIAPHHTTPDEYDDILKYVDTVLTVKWSDWRENDPFRVLVIDTIGILSKLYRYADVAYIGGGFSSGVHNTMEPSVHYVPCIFGNNYKKFPEAVYLVKSDLATVVNNSGAFEIALKKFLDNPDMSEVSEKLKLYTQQQLGAAEKSYQFIDRIIHHP